MIELEKFLKRTGMRQCRLAEILGMSRAMVTQLKKGRTEPTHSVCRGLLLAGMSVEELFGKDVQDAVSAGILSEYVGSSLSDEDCRRIVGSALARKGKNQG